MGDADGGTAEKIIELVFVGGAVAVEGIAKRMAPEMFIIQIDAAGGVVHGGACDEGG